ncbi:MAG: tetratricopeptide repeat protein [Magnetococcales bacterium]|nr:tetratricopeptide repeat protein [Magnetococcales bacterium]
MPERTNIGLHRLILMAALVMLLLSNLVVRPASAFFSAMEHSSDMDGGRETISFSVPATGPTPRLLLIQPKSARLTVPGLLALPVMFDLKKSRYIESIRVEEIRRGEMGIQLNLKLKEENLNLQGIVDKPRLLSAGGELVRTYRLLLEPAPKALVAGPTRLTDGHIFPGRDGTLLAIGFSGNGTMEPTWDISNRVVRLVWPKALVDPAGQSVWNNMVPVGLVDRLVVHPFGDYVEMEIVTHPSVEQLFFYRSPESGSLMVELRVVGGLGREKDAQAMLARRLEAIQQGRPLPFNRLVPMFVHSDKKVKLAGTDVDEDYFYDNARKSEQSSQFAKARAYLDSLLQVFPDTANREWIEFYKFDLATAMDWRSGWVLSELNTLLSRYPNTPLYSPYRLLQLRLLNDSSQFEGAASIMDDANLPHDSVAVLIERARAMLGLNRLDEAEVHLRRVMELDKKNGDDRARAQLMLAQLLDRRGSHPQAITLLDTLTGGQIGRLGNDPAHLMEVADLYYKNQKFPQALRFYTILLSQYPINETLSPWALLRAGDCQRHLGDRDDALRLFDQLALQFPTSESAGWGQIFKVQMATDKSMEERIAELEKIVTGSNLPGVAVEARLIMATLRGDAGQHREALEALNELLAFTSQESVRQRSDRLKRQYATAGMKKALTSGRPEYAVLLAELFGRDWRNQHGFEELQVLLAEALLRLGLYDKGVALLQGLPTPPAPELRTLAGMLTQGLREKEQINPVTLRSNSLPDMSPAAARVRLAAARRQAQQEVWKQVTLLLEPIPQELLNETETIDLLMLLARADAERGRIPEAVDKLETLLYKRPMGNGEYHYWYATLLQSWKGNANALPVFQRVAREAQDAEVRALAYTHVGDILKQAGDLSQAQQAYEEAAKLHPLSSMSMAAQENALQLKMIRGAVAE